MNNKQFSDDMLNMFIDNQLDTSEMNEIHTAMLADNTLRERVCKLRAVRELVGFAYKTTPRSRYDRRTDDSAMGSWRNVAAVLFVSLGVAIGWTANELGGTNAPMNAPVYQAAEDEKALHYFSEMNLRTGDERKIVLHITSGDIQAVKKALNEMDIMLASYNNPDTPMQIDVIANRDGINLLRADVSPYVDRIEQIMMSNANVKFYACERTINKLASKEHTRPELIRFIGRTEVDRSAQDLIPERLQQGWAYIKV